MTITSGNKKTREVTSGTKSNSSTYYQFVIISPWQSWKLAATYSLTVCKDRSYIQVVDGSARAGLEILHLARKYKRVSSVFARRRV
jgi:hypothetical protein